MSTVQHTARVKESGFGAIPDISTDGIAGSAFIMWTGVHEQRKRDGSRTRMDSPRTSQPGYAWSGSVNRIVNNIWPALKDPRLVDGQRAEHIKIALNRYLRNTGNLVCHREGNRATQSVWWISENWSALEVTPGTITSATQEAHETEENTEAGDADVFDLSTPDPGQQSKDVTDVKVDGSKSTTQTNVRASRDLPCRAEGCDRMFQHPQARGTHEKHTHSIRVMPDGTILTFTPGSVISHEETTDLILQLAEMFDAPETFNGFWVNAKQLDPRVVRETVRDILISNSTGKNSKLVVTNPKSQFHRYALRTTHKTQSSQEPVVNDTVSAEPAIDQDDVVCALSDDIKPVDDVQFAHVDGSSSKTGEHIQHLIDLIDDLKSLNRLEIILGETVKEVEKVTAERDEAREHLSRVSAELVECQTERDALQTKLDQFRLILGQQ